MKLSNGAMGLKQRVIRAVVGQFVRPRGLPGRLVGWEMAVRPSNRKRNLWAVELLEVQSTDRVLEIGFGPGVAIQALAHLTANGNVYGIDHSEVMVRQAIARNRRAVDEGRVSLVLGTPEDLARFEVLFDKALIVNNFGMWPSPARGLERLRNVMSPGGRVAIVTQPRCPGATVETTWGADREIAEQLREAGFTQIKTETLPLRPPVTCVMGHAPMIEARP